MLSREISTNRTNRERKPPDSTTHESVNFDWHPNGSPAASLLARHVLLARYRGCGLISPDTLCLSSWDVTLFERASARGLNIGTIHYIYHIVEVSEIIPRM